MKQKYIVFFAFILTLTIAGLVLFNACEKEQAKVKSPLDDEQYPVSSLSYQQKNLVIDDLAKLIALSLEDKEVRKMFKEEISLQFTLDYDILYRFISGKELNTDRFGRIRYEELLARLASDFGINFDNINRYADEFKNLQISGSMLTFDQWQTESVIPEVISLPVEYNENEGSLLNSYNSTGQQKKITDQEVPELFLVVRESERVDANGMMRIDLNSIVIPPKERAMTAETAYELARNKAIPIIKEPLIKILSENEMAEIIAEYSTKYKSFSQTNTINTISSVNDNEEKAGCSSPPATPVITKIFPKNTGQIEIQWTGPAGISQYEILRRKGNSSTVDVLNILLCSNCMTIYDDNNLTPMVEYTYQMRSVSGPDCKSALTAPTEVIPAFRTNNLAEYIQAVYVSRSAWNWMEGVLANKIELQFKGGVWSKSSGGVVRFPSGDMPLNMGQRTRAEQYNTWCTYNKYMFTWDMRNNSYNCRVMLFEDDADGTEITNSLGSSYQVSGGGSQGGGTSPGAIVSAMETITANLQVKHSIHDDFLGEVEIFYQHPPVFLYSFYPGDGQVLAWFGQTQLK